MISGGWTANIYVRSVDDFRILIIVLILYCQPNTSHQSFKMENMDTIQFRQRINERRLDGQPLRDDEINFITNQSTDLAGSPGMSLQSPDFFRRC